MKRLMIIIGVISMIFVIEACSSKSKNQITPPAPAPAEPAKSEPEVPVVPPWKIVLNSTCPDTSRDECVAGHGFTIVGDGKFLIGPAPQGFSYLCLARPT